MGLRSDLLRTLIGTQYMPDDKGWRTSLSLAVIPAVVLALGGWFLPETPNSLLERGKDAEARAILVKIRGTENVDNEYDDIKIAAQIATQVSLSLPAAYFASVVLLCFGVHGYMKTPSSTVLTWAVVAWHGPS